MPIFPLPFSSLSVAGRALSDQVAASLLSPKLNCMHYDVTRQCIGREGKYLKRRVILLEIFLLVRLSPGKSCSLTFKQLLIATCVVSPGCWASVPSRPDWCASHWWGGGTLLFQGEANLFQWNIIRHGKLTEGFPKWTLCAEINQVIVWWKRLFLFKCWNIDIIPIVLMFHLILDQFISR